jgi:hypothetical protein
VTTSGPAPETSALFRGLAVALVRAQAAILADLTDMAEGNYTGRHCQALLDARIDPEEGPNQ